ncbi:MAG: hypothetical protein H0V66_04935 [Bdellovibrionales bacterium]|nr:hypothetical protein [Bdellovibrionales bacterium]
MKNLVLTLSLALMTTGAFAAPEKFTVETVELKNFKSNLQGLDVGGSGSGSTTPGGPKVSMEQVGQVIATTKDIVALGESIYTLVQKGKPSNTTDFAPISIVPKDPISKEIVDPFDMEGCSFPVEKKFVTSIKTGGAEVVRFEYMVIYTYGCSYNGSGKYIQNAFVQPVSVKTTYGWDFNATMKLAGIMNHGTKAEPVVGAMLTIKYSMNSWRTAFERNDTVHITGKGELKSYTR